MLFLFLSLLFHEKGLSAIPGMKKIGLCFFSSEVLFSLFPFGYAVPNKGLLTHLTKYRRDIYD